MDTVERRCGSALAYVTAINGDVRFSVILTEISQGAALLFFKTIKELEWRADYNPSGDAIFFKRCECAGFKQKQPRCNVYIALSCQDFGFKVRFLFFFFSPSHFCLILNGLEE